jgi:glycosyltransferase involved in cell wall biosynthesis
MISVVIPVQNEEESLATLLAELSAVVAAKNLGDAEFIVVDDGSTDRTWAVVASIAAGDPRVRAIRFRRNFGKAAALSAGFGTARGEVIVTLDGDLQDDPAELPRFMEMIDRGYDVVSGWKRRRCDPWHKVIPSRVFNVVVSAVTGCRLHDHNCGFKAYRRQAAREIKIYGELHRFMPVLARSRGFRIGEIEVHHRPRRFGASKYGLARVVKGFVDLLTVSFLTKFRHRPMHLLGTLGIALLGLGALGITCRFAVWALGGHGIGGGEVLHASEILVIIGMQLLVAGLLAELLTSYQVHPDDTYSIAERLGTVESPSIDGEEAPR